MGRDSRSGAAHTEDHRRKIRAHHGVRPGAVATSVHRRARGRPPAVRRGTLRAAGRHASGGEGGRTIAPPVLGLVRA